MSENNENKTATDKDSQQKKGGRFGGVAKHIILSTIGTTISIILTFGSTSLIDKYQAAQSRKLLAMTIIHEIDKDIEQIRSNALDDYELYNFARNPGKLDLVPEDTLSKIHSLLAPNRKLPEFSQSNEHIFNSSQNTWSTIDNNIFISNVQDYYRLRSKLECALKEDTCFSPYISDDAYWTFDVVDGNKIVPKTMLETVSQYNFEAIYWKTIGRIDWYNTLLRYKSINEENKILMGISDKDLEEFAKKTADATIVSKNELIGTWIINNYGIDLYGLYNSGNIFTFHKNRTITVHNQKKYTSAKSGIGDIFVYYTATGDWKIEGDSLVMTFPADKVEVQIDDNDFYYSNVSQWIETQKNIEDETKSFGHNLRRFIYDLGFDLGRPFSPGESYVASVSAYIDRFGRAITMRNPHNRNTRRFERCDTITIPKYDFVKHPASEKEILGKWAWYEDANTVHIEFDHQNDHSFTIRQVEKERNADLFDGVMLVTRTISGEWKMENDSMVYYYDTKTLNLSIDDSQITYSPDKAGAVNGFKSQLKDIYTQRTLQSPRVAYQAIINAKRTEMIDKDGNVMFLYGLE